MPLNFRALVHPDTVYVGEQATLEVAVFVDDEVRERLRRNPIFYPPDLQSMLAYDLPTPNAGSAKRRFGARCYSALVFRRAVFPLVSGRLVIPPARLSYSLPSTGFFGREESVELRTDSVQVVAIDPPVEGRPPHFSGVVGAVKVEMMADSAAPRVGDPLRVVVRVTGTGNVKLFSRPELAVSWATLVPVKERVQIDSAEAVVGGTKEFEWLLTPRLDGSQEFPPVQYSFFNPVTRRYGLATAPGGVLHIRAGMLAAIPSVVTDSTPPLALRATLRPPKHRAITDMRSFWLLMASAPLPVLLRGVARRLPRRSVTAHRRLRALARARSAAPGSLRGAFVTAISTRVPLGVTPALSRGALAHALRRAGVSDRVALDADAVLAALDVAAYGDTGRDAGELAGRAYLAFRAIDREARVLQAFRRDLLRSSAIGVVMASATATSAIPSQLPDTDALERAFREGLGSYADHRYAAAAEAFVTAANRSPRSADAWANAGTASWANGDSAAAVLGWQRALRLEPLADDVREYLGMIDGASSGPGFVPPVPPDSLAIGAVLLWFVGWIAIPLRRDAARWERLAIALVLVAGIGVGLAVAGDTLLSGRDLAVVRTRTGVRPLPVLASDILARLSAGEITQVVGDDGDWIHVVGGRYGDGWVERTQLLFLRHD
ncbi:MAG: hypothetical protein NVS1B4_04660 [Gemmatimonadaceae bacterium]